MGEECVYMANKYNISTERNSFLGTKKQNKVKVGQKAQRSSMQDVGGSLRRHGVCHVAPPGYDRTEDLSLDATEYSVHNSAPVFPPPQYLISSLTGIRGSLRFRAEVRINTTARAVVQANDAMMTSFLRTRRLVCFWAFLRDLSAPLLLHP